MRLLIHVIAVLLSLSTPAFALEVSEAHLLARTLIEQLVGNDLAASANAKKMLATIPAQDYLFAGDAAQDYAQHAPLIIAALAPIKEKWKQQVEQQLANKIAADRANFLNYYLQQGRRNPAWDMLAEQALDFLARNWADDPSIGRYNYDKALVLLDSAIAAGCDDPLVLYGHIRVLASMDYAPADYTKQIITYAKAIAQSNLPPITRLLAQLRALDSRIRALGRKPKPEQLDKIHKELILLLPLYSEVAKDPSNCAQTFLNGTIIVSDIIRKATGDRKFALDALSKALEQAPTSWRAVIMASELRSYAWDARGGGYANTVTPEGWKLMSERLAQAHALLEQAWEDEPNNGYVATQMINVLLGENAEREVMERWWQRAMRADPHNFEACSNKMYFLEPKWHGSNEDMVEFGRRLLKEGNWGDRLPLQLVSAHKRAASYGDKDTYYKDPEVWADLNTVYTGFLKRFPDAIFDRTNYAWYAYQTEHWTEAHQQFEILGEAPRLSVFGSRGLYNYNRLRAKIFSSPTGPSILKARQLSILGQHALALTTFEKLSSTANDPDTLTVIRDERQSAVIRQALSTGEWVDLIVGNDLAGWQPLNGIWSRDGDRIKATAEEGYNRLLLQPICKNFELTGELQCSVNVSGKNAGLIFAYANGNSHEAVARYGWNAWCLEENFSGAGRHPVRSFPDGPLPVRLVVWNGQITLYHNNIEVAQGSKEASLQGRIGLGGYYVGGGSQIEFSKLRLRALTKAPTVIPPPNKPVPGANEF
jgi:tetratricopeptide (TPR) repeat protein